MNDRQCEVLARLVEDPGARVDGRSLPSLQRLGYLDADRRPTLFAWHALGRWKNAPQFDLPTDDLIASFKGKSIRVEESRECGCPNCGCGHQSAEFEIDAQRILHFTSEVRRRANEMMAKAWTREFDFKVERYPEDRDTRDKVAFIRCHYEREAQHAVTEDRGGIELRYTGHLVYAMGVALMENPSRQDLPEMATGEKSSFTDTDWEAEALRPAQGATQIASASIHLH